VLACLFSTFYVLTWFVLLLFSSSQAAETKTVRLIFPKLVVKQVAQAVEAQSGERPCEPQLSASRTIRASGTALPKHQVQGLKNRLFENSETAFLSKKSKGSHHRERSIQG
jgi:hypothetical protein